MDKNEHLERAEVRSKRVSLFVTCLVDMIYPHSGMAAVEVLERVGCAVDFPMAQTCCGQMGFNGGYRAEARQVARQFLRAFADSELIVTPSGSCAAMVRHHYPELFADEPEWRAQAQRAARITWELTEFLVDGLGVTDLGVTLAQPRTVAFHDACHGLRELGIRAQPRALLSKVGNLRLIEMNGADQCCGFGGLFAVKMPEISGAMLDDKLQNILASRVDAIVTCDASCLTQINGGLSRRGSRVRVYHIAEVLAGRL
ncbi:MAG: Fe-S oxidoreductase [Candidatus Thermofonsia Clade 1 bacterium]|jgi:L-lactate dehydrogenase complex protein LldE|uniref:Fe-S oxidoreductase n=1 Tax=Candidatus Thermofonsia Clade 1 bacterium TaxID=2364210 RepID=A0A2M8PC96_9CHLR|nr:MAG: Fe-S oxidoreductase [Candidatus Thermofonsia Clade 1 bacterium]RMF53141.1 MAG: (Fe-S)-binding protein [Chloroflexota bacterium]